MKPVGKTILDVEDKTGGIAAWALQYEAKLLTIVNIGKSKIYETARSGERMILLDKTDTRLIDPNTPPIQTFDLIVVDISLSRLESIFIRLHRFLHSKSRLITILKLQLGKLERSSHNNGIIKIKKIRFEGIEKVQEHILNKGYEIIKMTSIYQKDKWSEIVVLLESTQ